MDTTDCIEQAYENERGGYLHTGLVRLSGV
jgi:hypothetical protein